jgi:hypothetical protein
VSLSPLGVTTITTNQPQTFPSGVFSYPANVQIVLTDVTFSSFGSVAFCVLNTTAYSMPSLISASNRLVLGGTLTLYLVYHDKEKNCDLLRFFNQTMFRDRIIRAV